MVSDNNMQAIVVSHYKTPTFRLLEVGVYFLFENGFGYV